VQEKPGFSKLCPGQQGRIDILGSNGKKDNQAEAKTKNEFTNHEIKDLYTIPTLIPKT